MSSVKVFSKVSDLTSPAFSSDIFCTIHLIVSFLHLIEIVNFPFTSWKSKTQSKYNDVLFFMVFKSPNLMYLIMCQDLQSSNPKLEYKKTGLLWTTVPNTDDR